MKLKVVALFLGIIGTAFFLSTPATAQTTPERELLITPLRTELSIEAGTVYKGTVTLKNTGQDTLTISLDAEAFGVINQAYDYTFLPDSPINDWVNFSQDRVTLDPNESYVAQYLISVPINAEPGGKYISLFAATLPSETTSITSTERLGSLVYITVPGDITRLGNLLSLNSPVFATASSTWSATVQNTGTAHFRSNYGLRLQTLWDSDISSREGNSLILPASVRLISNTLPVPEWLGIYKLQYSFELGDNPGVIETRYIIYAPPTQLLAFIGGIALIGAIITALVRLRNRRVHNG